MRPIARQSTRLAASTRSRNSSVPRHPQRAIHNSTRRQQDPRPPSSNPDHHTPFNESREPQKKPENIAPKTEQVVEQEGEAKTAYDGRKPGLRKTFRQRRLNDAPKPPPIPDWFLEHNVRLYRGSPGLGVNKENGQVIRCVDSSTGHVLFTVPYYDAWPKLLDRERRHKPRDTQPEHRDVQSKVEEEIGRAKEAVAEGIHSSAKGKSALEEDFFDHKFQATKATSQRQYARAKEANASTDFIVPKGAVEADAKSDPMRWIFLEAEMSARAALSLPTENQRSSSFAADRVDLSFQCPDDHSHDQMDGFVSDLARILQADVVRLDVNDFAELTADYVGQGHDEPGSFSTLGYDVYDGYAASSLESHAGRTQGKQDEENEEDEAEEDEEEEDDHSNATDGNGISPFTPNLQELLKRIQDTRSGIGKALRGRVIGIGIGVPQSVREDTFSQPRSRPMPPHESSDMNRDDARLGALLDHLLDAPRQKTASTPTSDDALDSRRKLERRKYSPHNLQDHQSKSYQNILRHWRSNSAFWLPQTAQSLIGYLGKTIQDSDDSMPAFKLTSEDHTVSEEPARSSHERPKTIVHIRDLRDICNSRLGESIIHRLIKVVRKRRRSGERILVVGSTAQDVPGPFRLPGDHSVDGFPFRTISVPPFFNFSLADDSEFENNVVPTTLQSLDNPAYRRILEINLRHIQSMLRRLRPDEQIELHSAHARNQLNMPGMHFLTQRVLTLDQVQRLALIAVGLSESHARSDTLQPIHIALAAFISTKSDHAETSWAAFNERKTAKKFETATGSVSTKSSPEAETGQARLDRLKKSCNSHETRLFSGVVDPQHIKTGFADVHATPDTIEALKTLTTLSLLRPDAFKYGILANDRLPGLLLYGPPGTGKTLLAKAVARESKATVLEVSGAQIYEKYVGEGEKMVRAVFSLAKKLTPCVVFIDEADAIFGSRSNAGNRNTHREIINQFLREWDGMDDHGVFMMVATNRPFDLDDAVLRRLPRRLLVDLPVAKDRESILGIHLKNENVDSSVSFGKLAEQTPLYSGSDLKNVAVSAALACVREENELAESRKDDKEFKLPEKRTLTAKHFDKALAEVSASISEDMTSLTAIRKFDEQYGDRKGRKKKMGYGFGTADEVVDEGAARVRPPSASPPPA